MNNNHSKKCEQLIDYYNGQLNQTDCEAFEKHLAECPDCQQELAELEALNADLVHGLEQVEPPEDMESRILTNIFDSDTENNEKQTKNDDVKPDKKRNGTSNIYKKMMLPLAAALFLSVIGNVYLWSSQETSDSLSQVLVNEEEAVTLQPSAETQNMDAQMAMHEEGGQQTLVLEANNFTNLNEGEVYQVWLMEDEQPYRAGTFVPNENGNGYIVFTLDESADIDWDMVAITIEGSPHNDTPQGDIVMSSEF